MVGALLKLLLGRPVVYDVHENYPQDILTKEWIPAWVRKPFSALFKVVEETAARWMDGVVVVNEHLAERFRGKSRVATIFNYSRLESGPRTQHSTHSPEHRPVRYFVYAGRISDDRGLYEGAQALERLDENDVELLCAGRIGHVAEEGLRELLEGQPPHSRFKYLGLLPYEAIPPLLQDALAGLLCFRPTPNNVLGTPNKLFEYISMGKPVVCTDLPSIRAVFDDSTMLFYQRDDHEELARRVLELHADLTKGERLAQEARRVFVNHSWSKMRDVYIGLHDELVSPSKHDTPETPAASSEGPP